MVLAVAALLARVVLDGHIVDAADDDVIGNDAICNVLRRQIGFGNEIAMIAEIVGQRISALLQVGKGQVFPFFVRQQVL